MLATGDPRRPSGVIDFARAHLERREADIAYALWRSGRPNQNATVLDLQRTRDFVRGYAGAGHLDEHAARIIAVHLWGRGLQMLAKRLRAGRVDGGPMAQVRWLRDHQQQVVEAVSQAI